MRQGGAVRLETVEDRAVALFDRIREFLLQHRLSPDPSHYAFAHRVSTDVEGTLARAVAALTEGGIRLSARDIKTLSGRVAVLNVPDLASDEALPETADGLIAQTQMQVEGFTDLMLAIRAETQDFGRDLATSADAMRYSDTIDEVVLLTTVMLDRVQAAEAKLAAATQEADELRAKLEEARDDASRDPLTGLPNRRAFEETFAMRITEGASMVLAVCDVDRFKRVNDRFGHSVGDRVLKAIANTLSQTCDGHFVARHGGEEFVILFCGVDLPTALATLEGARETIADKRYRLRESDEPLGAVTFSAGLTAASADESLGTVFGRADTLLYAAKDAGRNQLRAK